MTVALREPLEGRIVPGHEALLVRGDLDAFALTGRWAGGGALVGSRPVRRADTDADPFAVRPLALEELASASEVILASALRGTRAAGASGAVTAAIRDRQPSPA